MKHFPTQILNIGVLPVTSQGQAKAISQGLSSRTVTFKPFVSKIYCCFMSDLCRLLYHLCTQSASCVTRDCNFRISF